MTQPSLESLRLRALALELLPSIAKRGDCVAITGSAARGNATPGSDLDLWVLGRRSGRVVQEMNGTSVTLLCQRPAEARAFDNLCLFEVDDLLLLDDRAGAFEALRAAWKRSRRRVRAEVIRSTQRQVELELSRGSTGSDWHRATFLRFAAWRLLCLRVFIDHGWRVPRLHALRAVLPKHLSRRLDAVLELPSPKQTRAALSLLPAAVREAKRLGLSAEYELPETLEVKVGSGELDEAAFLARRELVEDIVPAVFARWGITDVRGVELLGSVAPKLQRSMELLCAAPGKKTVRALERELAGIRRAL